MTKEEFINRFVASMASATGDQDINFIEHAEASWGVYEEDGNPDNMTPEEWAEAERDCWD